MPAGWHPGRWPRSSLNATPSRISRHTSRWAPKDRSWPQRGSCAATTWTTRNSGATCPAAFWTGSPATRSPDYGAHAGRFPAPDLAEPNDLIDGSVASVQPSEDAEDGARALTEAVRHWSTLSEGKVRAVGVRGDHRDALGALGISSRCGGAAQVCASSARCWPGQPPTGPRTDGDGAPLRAASSCGGFSRCWSESTRSGRPILVPTPPICGSGCGCRPRRSRGGPVE